MLHLLSEEQKKKVSGEYARRVWVVACLGIVVVLIISTVFLVPIYMTSYGRYADALRTKDALDSKIASSQDSTAAQSVREITTTLSLLQEFKMSSVPSALIESMVSERPSNVRLSHISYTPNPGDAAAVDIQGVALTRNDLVVFSNNLKQDPDFISVYIPISDFAKEKNVNFSAKLIAATSSVPTNQP